MVYTYLLDILKKRPGLFALLDPAVELPEIAIKTICTVPPRRDGSGADAILVGGSFVKDKPFRRACFDGFVKLVKSFSKVPVILFPGDAMQVSKYADAILFLSLLSGRNPDYLIGEHIKASPAIKKIGLEVIPTGYILIESGTKTSVMYKSHTSPISPDQINVVKAHALAGQYLGMKFIYLEAGSGALHPVPDSLISAVKKYISIPLIVGGGLKTQDAINEKLNAGADFIVVGNALQNNPDLIKKLKISARGGSASSLKNTKQHSK